MKIKDAHDYFWHQRELNPERKEISLDHCQYVLDHRDEGLHYEQPDGKFRYTAPIPELGYWLQVIMVEDREPLFNTFEDAKRSVVLSRDTGEKVMNLEDGCYGAIRKYGPEGELRSETVPEIVLPVRTVLG